MRSWYKMRNSGKLLDTDLYHGYDSSYKAWPQTQKWRDHWKGLGSGPILRVRDQSIALSTIILVFIRFWMRDGLNGQALPVHHTEPYNNHNFKKGWHFTVFWSVTLKIGALTELGLFFPVAYFICVWSNFSTAAVPWQRSIGAWHTNGWPLQKFSKFGFCTQTTALWPIEQSSILSAKFDCPVAHQNLSLLVTAHGCETDLRENRASDDVLNWTEIMKDKNETTDPHKTWVAERLLLSRTKQLL